MDENLSWTLNWNFFLLLTTHPQFHRASSSTRQQSDLEIVHIAPSHFPSIAIIMCYLRGKRGCFLSFWCAEKNSRENSNAREWKVRKERVEVTCRHAAMCEHFESHFNGYEETYEIKFLMIFFLFLLCFVEEGKFINLMILLAVKKLKKSHNFMNFLSQKLILIEFFTIIPCPLPVNSLQSNNAYKSVCISK